MRYFTSDLHLGHTNVIRYCKRPYESVEQMNESLVDNWNAVVKSSDDVYVMGDFSLSATAVKDYVPRLKGRKHLIKGNHDRCHPASPYAKTLEKQTKQEKFYLDCGWESVQLEGELDLLSGRYPVRLYHMPYKEQALEEGKPQNHPKWRLEDTGKILICGHVHDAWKMRVTERGTLMVNVGVDVWDMRPISENELAQYIEWAQVWKSSQT